MRVYHSTKIPWFVADFFFRQSSWKMSFGDIKESWMLDQSLLVMMYILHLFYLQITVNKNKMDELSWMEKFRVLIFLEKHGNRPIIFVQNSFIKPIFRCKKCIFILINCPQSHRNCDPHVFLLEKIIALFVRYHRDRVPSISPLWINTVAKFYFKYWITHILGSSYKHTQCEPAYVHSQIRP